MESWRWLIANIGTSVPKTAYQYEVGSSASTTTYDAKNRINVCVRLLIMVQVQVHGH